MQDDFNLELGIFTRLPKYNVEIALHAQLAVLEAVNMKDFEAQRPCAVCRARDTKLDHYAM